MATAPENIPNMPSDTQQAAVWVIEHISAAVDQMREEGEYEMAIAVWNNRLGQVIFRHFDRVR